MIPCPSCPAEVQCRHGFSFDRNFLNTRLCSFMLSKEVTLSDWGVSDNCLLCLVAADGALRALGGHAMCPCAQSASTCVRACWLPLEAADVVPSCGSSSPLLIAGRNWAPRLSGARGELDLCLCCPCCREAPAVASHSRPRLKRLCCVCSLSITGCDCQDREGLRDPPRDRIVPAL